MSASAEQEIVTSAQLETEVASELDALVSAEPETALNAEFEAESDEEDEELDEESDDDSDEESDEESYGELDDEADDETEPSRGKYPHDEESGGERNEERNEERLQKILAHAGIASRRHAEELIAAGRVQVNGETITTAGFKADPERDHIRVDGKLLHGSERLRYFMLNKPRGYVTTVSDPEGRPTVMQFFSRLGERLYPVGRLDFLSEGLLLVTNDGPLANKLTRAASGVEKTYLVKVSGEPSEEELDRLRAGVAIPKGRTTGVGRVPARDRVRTAPARIRQVRSGANPWLEVVLIEGRNRELRKMFEEIGHHVEKIRRVGYGPLHLVNLDPGAIRELTTEELDLLRRAAEGRYKSRPIDFGVLLPKEAGRSVDHEAAKERGKRPYAPRFNKPFLAAEGERREGGKSFAPRVGGRTDQRPGPGRGSDRGPNRGPVRSFDRSSERGPNRSSGSGFDRKPAGRSFDKPERTESRPFERREGSRPFAARTTPRTEDGRGAGRSSDRGPNRTFDRKPAGRSFDRPERREDRPFERREGGRPFAGRTTPRTDDRTGRGSDRGAGRPAERKPFGGGSGFKSGFKPGGKPGFGQRSDSRPAAKSGFGPRSDFAPKSGRPPARFKPDAERSVPYKSSNSGLRIDNVSSDAPRSRERQDRGGFKPAGDRPRFQSDSKPGFKSSGSRPAFKSSGGGSGFKSGSKPGAKSGFKPGFKSAGGGSGFKSGSGGSGFKSGGKPGFKSSGGRPGFKSGGKPGFKSGGKSGFKPGGPRTNSRPRRDKDIE